MPFEFLNALKNDFKNLDLDEEDYDEEVFGFETENRTINLSEPTQYSSLLIFFNELKSLRNESEINIIKLFEKCYTDAPLESIILVFYLRDKLKGLGERRSFKIILNYLGKVDCDIIKRNLHLIPMYGRYDDYYALFDTKMENEVIKIISQQIEDDLSSNTPSTLGKWLKSENTSSKESRELGKKTRILLGLTSKEYRLLLTKLRAKIGLIEHTLSQKDYGNIEYGTIPKRALYKYKNAFERNDNEKYISFIRFTAKINSNIISVKSKALTSGVKIGDTIFPYDIMSKISDLNYDYSNDIYCNIWSNMPNYNDPKIGDTMVILGFKNFDEKFFYKRDIFKGGVGTTLYIKEKNTGVYKNHIITMKESVNFKKIQGDNLKERINEIVSASNFYNINIEGALDLILLTAIKKQLSNSDIPNRLLVILDEDCIVPFLQESENRNDFNNFIQEYEIIKKKWSLSGLILPSLTFWYIESKKKFNIKIFNQGNIQIVHGYSNEIFLNILQNRFESSFDKLSKILNSERYETLK